MSVKNHSSTTLDSIHRGSKANRIALLGLSSAMPFRVEFGIIQLNSIGLPSIVNIEGGMQSLSGPMILMTLVATNRMKAHCTGSA